MSDRLSSQALRGRATGVIVGSAIAMGWAVYGLASLGPGLRYPLLAVALALSAVLLRSGVAIRRRAGSMPKPTTSQAATGKRVWRWFWLNFVGEIVLLNIAVSLLAANGLNDYLIPAISAVVGLHFWPMAHFFRVTSYWWVGAAMMGGAAIAAVLIQRDPGAAFAIVHAEGLANALILWAALGIGVVAARRS